MKNPPRITDSRLLRISLITLGGLCVALGFLGIFLPLLPTTPFLLLAAACFARSSRRFSHWLYHNRLCGPYLRRYQQGLGMSVSHKLGSLFLLWGGVAFTCWRVSVAWWVQLLLAVVVLAVSAHIYLLPTWRKTAAEAAVSQNGEPKLPVSHD